MTDTKTTTTLHDSPVPLRAKLAAAWTSFMFLYIYVDYFSLYKPGIIDDILAGTVFKFDISQTFVLIALTSVAIPMFMILMTSPVYVPRPLIEGWVATATKYNPFTAIVEAGRSLMAGNPFHVALAFAAAAGLSAAMVVFARRGLRKAEAAVA